MATQTKRRGIRIAAPQLAPRHEYPVILAALLVGMAIKIATVGAWWPLAY